MDRFFRNRYFKIIWFHVYKMNYFVELLWWRMSSFAKRYTEELINSKSLQFLFRHSNWTTIEIRMTSIGNIQSCVSQIKFHNLKALFWRYLDRTNRMAMFVVAKMKDLRIDACTCHQLQFFATANQKRQ